jgi:hypothetical protein
VNALLSGVLALERRVRRGFPFGLSVFGVGQKPPAARDTIRRSAEEAEGEGG